MNLKNVLLAQSTLTAVLTGCNPTPPACLQDAEYMGYELDDILEVPVALYVFSDDLYGQSEEHAKINESFLGAINGLYFPLAIGSEAGEPRFILKNVHDSVLVVPGDSSLIKKSYTDRNGVEHLPNADEEHGEVINIYFGTQVAGDSVYSPILRSTANYGGYVPDIGGNFMFLANKDPTVFLHELGHSLGLFHTHETVFKGAGDMIADTPEDPGPGACDYIDRTYACGRNSEGELLMPDLLNAMGYFNEYAVVERESGPFYTKYFSDGQVSAMTCVVKSRFGQD